MKKSYCTPVMEISLLEMEDVVCASTLSVNISYTEPTMGETPPMDIFSSSNPNS